MPVIQLSALPLLAAAVASGLDPSAVVVAPDVGAAKRAEAFGAALRLPVAFVHKGRLSGAEVFTTGVLGDVRKREAVIIDDMISTGATIEAATAALRTAGFAGQLTVAVTHAVLTASAAQRVRGLGLRRLIATDTVAPLNDDSPVSQVVTVAPLIASAIREIRGSRRGSSRSFAGW
jgi:ribose-phosphate pyrophosphokinase